MTEQTLVNSQTADLPANILTNYTAFENAQRIAKALMQASLVPQHFQNNLPNCLIALEIAQRTGNSPIAVMQNLNVIQGAPRWSSKYVISNLVAKKVTNLDYKITHKGKKKVEYTTYSGGRSTPGTIEIEDITCCVTAKDRKTGQELVGPEVSLEMAVKEGWYTKPGSKWKTMPEIMLRYRAATFFANTFYPDFMLGIDGESSPGANETYNEPISVELPAEEPVPPISAKEVRPQDVSGSEWTKE